MQNNLEIVALRYLIILNSYWVRSADQTIFVACIYLKMIFTRQHGLPVVWQIGGKESLGSLFPYKGVIKRRRTIQEPYLTHLFAVDHS